MLAKDIAIEFRTQVDDEDTDDPLWTDVEVVRYMNLAQHDFAKRTLCLADASTASVVQLAVTNTSKWVPYSPLILEFDPMSAYSAVLEREIPILDKYDFHRRMGGDDYGLRRPLSTGWRTRTGSAQALISGIEVDKLRIYPIPTADDTLEVQVKRLPINLITDISSTSVEVPEIQAMFHEDLIVYMMHRAYLKQDAECYDKGMSADYLDMWENETIPEAKSMLKRSTVNKGSVARYRSNG
jgi:hypothetical protein